MGRSSKRQRPEGRKAPDHSELLLERYQGLLGEQAAELLAGLQTPAPVSIRTEPQKWAWKGTDPVPWCNSAWYLHERPAFTFDPLFHAGCYYVQEASSMLLERALIASGCMDRPIVALDLCAAPGGKSTHLRNLLHADSLLVANEIDHKRRAVLCENLWKAGSSNVLIGGSKAQELEGLPEFFDLILVDAPCSGQGMFRKDPFARAQWSPELVEHCARMQEDIVAHAYRALAPGGTLIYSTCTWEVAENEARMATLIDQGATSIPLPVKVEWGIEQSMNPEVHALRCYPHRVKGEGFFLSALRKPGGPGPFPERHAAVVESERDLAGHVLTGERSWVFLEQDGTQYAVDGRWAGAIREIRAALRIHAPGLPYSEPKGRGIQFHPGLAYSKDLDHDKVQQLPMDLDQAVRYLQGHSMPADDAKDAALVTYSGLGLGWAQGAGTRWNNRYPDPWRIRSRSSSAPDVSWARTAAIPGDNRSLDQQST